jgi:hypothetical protein
MFEQKIDKMVSDFDDIARRLKTKIDRQKKRIDELTE